MLFKRQRTKILAWLFLCLAAGPAYASHDMYSFLSQQKYRQFTRLSSELRCLVCQNQNLANSTAGLAKDLRKKLYTMVQSGRTDSFIKGYFTHRYGDFILFSPPLKYITYLLWFGPYLFLILGCFVIIWILMKAPSSRT